MSPEGKLLIIQQEREGQRSWGTVGGALDHGETIEECAVREAYEESGLHVRLSRLISVDQFWHAGVFRGVGFNFLAEPDPWPQAVAIPEFDGAARFLDYRWVAKEDAGSYFLADAWELWTQFWPPEIDTALVRKLDFKD